MEIQQVHQDLEQEQVSKKNERKKKRERGVTLTTIVCVGFSAAALLFSFVATACSTVFPQELIIPKNSSDFSVGASPKKFKTYVKKGKRNIFPNERNFRIPASD